MIYLSMGFMGEVYDLARIVQPVERHHPGQFSLPGKIHPTRGSLRYSDFLFFAPNPTFPCCCRGFRSCAIFINQIIGGPFPLVTIRIFYQSINQAICCGHTIPAFCLDNIIISINQSFNLHRSVTRRWYYPQLPRLRNLPIPPPPLLSSSHGQVSVTESFVVSLATHKMAKDVFAVPSMGFLTRLQLIGS